MSMSKKIQPSPADRKRREAEAEKRRSETQAEQRIRAHYEERLAAATTELATALEAADQLRMECDRHAKALGKAEANLAAEQRDTGALRAEVDRQRIAITTIGNAARAAGER